MVHSSERKSPLPVNPEGGLLHLDSFFLLAIALSSVRDRQKSLNKFILTLKGMVMIITLENNGKVPENPIIKLPHGVIGYLANPHAGYPEGVPLLAFIVGHGKTFIEVKGFYKIKYPKTVFLMLASEIFYPQDVKGFVTPESGGYGKTTFLGYNNEEVRASNKMAIVPMVKEGVAPIPIRAWFKYEPACMNRAAHCVGVDDLDDLACVKESVAKLASKHRSD